MFGWQDHAQTTSSQVRDIFDKPKTSALPQNREPQGAKKPNIPGVSVRTSENEYNPAVTRRGAELGG